MIVYLITTQIAYLKAHGQRDGTGAWWCKTTGAKMMGKVIGRSLWIRPFTGGPGEVRQVTHLYCASCDKDPAETIKPGDPIYQDELTEHHDA